jgi:hypothetical protein
MPPHFMAHVLENYLRTYRKRFGLTQDEVAFSRGSTSGDEDLAL